MSKKSFKTSFDSLLGEEQIKPKGNNKMKDTRRATFIVSTSHLEKLKAIAFWEKKMIMEVLDDALLDFFVYYEAKHGPIQLP